jgi:hypothetical protein
VSLRRELLLLDLRHDRLEELPERLEVFELAPERAGLAEDELDRRAKLDAYAAAAASSDHAAGHQNLVQMPMFGVAIPRERGSCRPDVPVSCAAPTNGTVPSRSIFRKPR